MLRSISLTEWLVIALVVILLFGLKRIPDFFKGLSEAVKEFKKAANSSTSDKNSS